MYSPTETTKSDSAKLAFYSALNKAKDEMDSKPKYKLIVLGDFNATISSASKDSGTWDAVLGNNNSDQVETNNNGERMLAWCLKNRMKITNTIFRTKRIHRETWRHAATGKWKRIDYICTSRWLMKFVRSCRVFIGPSRLFDTDHRVVVMDIEFPGTKKQLRKQLSVPTRTITPKTEYRAVRDCSDTRERLTEKLDSELNDIELSDIDELNEKIVSTVRQCVDAVCPTIDHVKKKQPWEDDKLQLMIKELRAQSSHTEMRKQQKAIKNRRQILKNDYYREIANNIKSAAEARQVEKEFALAKKYSSFKESSNLRISNDKLKTHFQGHFAARDIQLPPELARPDEYSYLQDQPIEINEGAPTE